jgi:hypothetical protein
MLKRSEKLWMGSAIFFGIFALVSNAIGFTTPYWIQIWPRYIFQSILFKLIVIINLVLAIQHFAI